MKEETLKATIKKIDWVECKDFSIKPLHKFPASQGYMIIELIKHYKIPFKQVGYHMDIVGIRTKKQIMLWKDQGVQARFLGLLNIDDNTIHMKDGEKKCKEKMFETMTELRKEIRKRDYNNIKGLKAKISADEYTYALEVLPPMKWENDTFILSEALSGNLYYQFSAKEKKFFCEVIELEDKQIMEMEM